MLSRKKYLRTFDNYANIKFEIDLHFNQDNIIYHDKESLNVKTKKTLFVLENVLTNQECDNLIKLSDPHYAKLDDEYKIDERDSYRVLADDTYFSDVLYSRIQKYLHDDNIINKDIKPCGFGIEGKWTPLKINNCFRYSKYVKDSYGFAPHRDATYIENENIRSILTILIYLNDDFEKGNTIFYKTLQKRQTYQTVSDEMKGGYVERFRYKVKKGSVLIFDHNMIHSGEDLINSNSKSKYLIRSDIVFQCERYENYKHDWLSNKYFLEAIELYREAFNQELDGNLEASSKLYQKALALRQFHK